MPSATLNAMPVDGDGANLRACRDERKTGQGITRILDPDLLLRTLHDADHDIDSLLGCPR
jgi:hypothetical protein